MGPGDPYDLQRFVDAQDPVIAQVERELREGRKRSHWMWFVFPQLRGLGHSPMAERYAIGSRGEARAYLAHPILGLRLRDCTGLVNRIEGRTAHDVFGTPDDLKFRSCMTLFARIAGAENVFVEALDRHFGGLPDDRTMELLAALD